MKNLAGRVDFAGSFSGESEIVFCGVLKSQSCLIINKIED